MTWPTSKASTQNVDQSTDRIVDARPDILQNIQNTNEIIDKFVISSPANQDILIANASNQLITAESISINPLFAYVEYQTGGAGNEAYWPPRGSSPKPCMAWASAFTT